MAYLHVFAKYLAFAAHLECSTLNNIKHTKKITKSLRKNLTQLALNPFFKSTSETLF